jgi:hypothetical protein
MRRTLLLLAVTAVMAMMLVAYALPAFAAADQCGQGFITSNIVTQPPGPSGPPPGETFGQNHLPEVRFLQTIGLNLGNLESIGASNCSQG